MKFAVPHLTFVINCALFATDIEHMPRWWPTIRRSSRWPSRAMRA